MVSSMATPDLSKMSAEERKAYIKRIEDRFFLNLSSERYEKLMQEMDETQIKYVSTSEMREHQKQIDNVNTKFHEKERKKAERDYKKSVKIKPDFLISLSGFFSKIFHNILALYSMVATGAIIFFAWQIYKVCAVAGWHGLIETRYSLYVVCCVAVYFVLKGLYFALYKYATD